jgi:hypothetical protein
VAESRAAALGANDGIVSTASLIVGGAAAAAQQTDILIAGVAGLVAGAMSMAAGGMCICEFAIRHRAGPLERKSQVRAVGFLRSEKK